jgi:hypothetical protein
MNVYTKLGVHDLAAALDTLPPTSEATKMAVFFRQTGTESTAPGCKQPAQQRRHETARSSATRRDGAEPSSDGAGERKPLRIRKKRDVKRRRARSRAKATSRIRTGDLCFTKAEKTSVSDCKNRTSSVDDSNGRSNGLQGEDLAVLNDALAAIPEEERGAIVALVQALIRMGSAKRTALLGLTDTILD